MNKKIKNAVPELLCPVGSQLALRAAVENGADAVYLGLDKYSARNIEESFTTENITEALNYCHLRGVKVYVALNTILLDSELEDALEIAKELYIKGVDSLIVQDIGLLDRLSKELPDMPVHISTQATIYSAKGIRSLEKYTNIKRVVLARETTIEEIREIKKECNLPIEVFVHGALCISYSGQCLMSSVIGARSGNRGRCAQPCRMKYDIVQKDKMESFMAPKELVKQKYCMSPKDLCLLENIPNLISAGVDSFKVEGRMKSPEYVGIVTRIYRKYIDKAMENKEYIVDEIDKKQLMQIFCRGGFTKGYLETSNPNDLVYNELPKHTGIYLGNVIEYIKDKGNIVLKLEEKLNMGDGVEVRNDFLPGSVVSFIRCGKERVNTAEVGSLVTIGDIKGNVSVGDKIYKISNKQMCEEISQTYMHGKNIKKVDVIASVIAKIGEPFKLELIYMNHKVEAQSEKLCEKGLTRSLSEEDINQNVNKFGDTSFNISKLNIDMDEGVIVPISQINSVRREVVLMLETSICKGYERELKDTKIPVISKNNKVIKANKISAYLYNPNNLEGLENVDKIYIPFHKIIQNMDIMENIKRDNVKNKEIFIDLGNISKGEIKNKIVENMTLIKSIGNVLVGNLEQLEMLKDLNLNIEIDSSLNIYNSSSIKAFEDMGISKLSLSNELTTNQITRLDNCKMELSVNIYGRIPVMTMQSCVIANNISKKIHCGICNKQNYYLKDRVGEMFPIYTNTIDCRNTLLSSDTVFNLEAVEALKEKITTFRLYFLDETITQRRNVISKLKAVLETGEYINHSTDGYSKGHFNRGV